MLLPWRRSLGAWPDTGGVHFRVWAPTLSQVEVITSGPGGPQSFQLDKQADGYFAGYLIDGKPGDQYRYRLDGGQAFPDPASRFQPEGPHGSSEVIDPGFPWSDQDWLGIRMEDAVIYELHVGAFTPGGSFADATEKLPYLSRLGITAIELMPVACFPGKRNWGYDGVDLFAPSRQYGRPEDLRRLVNEAHRQGLAVFLDVVYNHFGPDGNYLSQFSPYFFNPEHHTPWGASLNFDSPHGEAVRAFYVENALHWLHEYHFDGLRFDATHAMIDESSRHILREIVERVHEEIPSRRVLLMAEDHRNLAAMVRPLETSGWGLDAVWADDFHHQMRRCLAGDNESYYRDFSGSTTDIAATIQQGWFYTGQPSVNHGEPRGTDPAGLPSSCFIICLQNHDQIGNRAFGDRLNHQIDFAALRSATALLLTAPQTPLLFMGQEWAASTPFQFFTDHNPELGRLVTEGRRNEFRDFASFADLARRERIPDPQVEQTFLASKLKWGEVSSQPHAGINRLHQDLLRIRRDWTGVARHEAGSPVDGVIVLRRIAADGSVLLVIAALRPQLQMTSPFGNGEEWSLLLSTEDAAYAQEPRPPELNTNEPSIYFSVPAALVFRVGPEKRL